MNKKTSILFTKMQGLGNDFVVVDLVTQSLDIKQLPLERMSNRHFGIGFDQLLTIEPAESSNAVSAHFFCHIFNKDGSQAEQCGNGLRCVARFIHEQSLSPSPHLRLETKAGIFESILEDYDHISITMGVPIINIPQMELALSKTLVSGPLCVISMGNPHAILKINSVDGLSINESGQAISTHPFFPQGTNVGFMEIVNRSHIRLRTYERGAGSTHACGSNACAAVVAGITNNELDHQVKVEFRYGSLHIEWAGADTPIKMTGEAKSVFTGEWCIK
jgi:diaminopimelate epimerase